MEDVPSAALFILKKTPSDPQLAGFHLSLPMGYANSAPYFCIATNTVANLANEAITQHNVAGKHPLKEAANARAVDDAGAPEA